MAYFDKFNVARYIIDKYQKEKGYKISPLKLQKSLYLLFAMWGGNARLINRDIDGKERVEYEEKFDECLFEPSFEAWVRGPVDREVYNWFKNDSIEGKNNLEVEEANKDVKGTLISFIDSILEQTFEVNDFALVDLTHKDAAWINNFYPEENYHDRIIPSEEIIKEYYQRFNNAVG